MKKILFLFFGYFCMGGIVLFLLHIQQESFFNFLLESKVFDFLPIIYTLKGSNIFDSTIAHKLLVFFIGLGPFISFLQFKYVDFNYLYPKKIESDTAKKIVSIFLSCFVIFGFYYTDWTTRMTQKALISFPLGFLFISSAYIYFFYLFAVFLLKILISYFQDKK